MEESEKRLRDLAEELRDADDEITAEHLLDAVKAGAVIATGKHRPMSKTEADDRITPTDPPKSLDKRSRFALAVLDRLPRWSRPVIVLAALAIVGLLLWRGVALAGLLP